MSQQRRIDLLFAATVRAMDVARVVRGACPALAVGLVSVVAVHGTLGGLDAPMSAVRVADLQSAPTVGTGPARDAAAVAPAAPAAPGDAHGIAERAPVESEPSVAPAAVAPVRQLDREQQNIAKFIAARYRVTIDATTEFVYHAYRAAKDTKVDPLLVLAVMSVESSFNPKAQSHAGAQGLMQVLTRVHVDKFLPFGGIPAAFDPVANIRVGSAILKQYIQREGTVEGALKSYVGAALAEHDGGYGAKVLNARERIAAAAAGRPIPPEYVPAPVARVDAQPVMVPVSTIVETRTPLPIVEEPRAAAPVVPPDAAHVATHLSPHAPAPVASSVPSHAGDLDRPATPVPPAAPTARGHGI
jgi:soluble lytic murein transglycosylase-like protein